MNPQHVLEFGGSSVVPTHVTSSGSERPHAFPSCKLVFCLIVLQLCLCLRAQAQNYNIDWYKIAGGGGTSSNGQYTISGTIGQHDAGASMTGGSYSLTGGFWSLSVVQTPGAPILSISRTGPTTVLVWWLADVGNYKLQTNATLSSSSWANYSSPIDTAGGTNSVTISPRSGNLFFRLSP